MSSSATQHSTPVFANRRLKQAQREAGLTNEELAGRIGVAVRLLQLWRSGKGAPGGANLAALTVALDRDASWFYGEPESEAA